MWETAEIVGINHTASLTVCQDCSGFKGVKTAHRRRKIALGWFSIGSHVLFSLIPRACYMAHYWQQYGEDPLHSSKAYEGRGFKLSYCNVAVKSVPSKCFLGSSKVQSSARPDGTGFLPLSHGLIWCSQQALCLNLPQNLSLVVL